MPYHGIWTHTLLQPWCEHLPRATARRAARARRGGESIIDECHIGANHRRRRLRFHRFAWWNRWKRLVAEEGRWNVEPVTARVTLYHSGHTRHTHLNYTGTHITRTQKRANRWGSVAISGAPRITRHTRQESRTVVAHSVLRVVHRLSAHGGRARLMNDGVVPTKAAGWYMYVGRWGVDGMRDVLRCRGGRRRPSWRAPTT